VEAPVRGEAEKLRVERQLAAAVAAVRQHDRRHVVECVFR